MVEWPLICAQYVQEDGTVEAIARAYDLSEWCIRECESTCKLGREYNNLRGGQERLATLR